MRATRMGMPSLKPNRIHSRLLGLAPPVLALLVACASLTERADKIASQAGLEPLQLTGEGFVHRAFYRAASGGPRLIVFVEGDGSPRGNVGREAGHDAPRTKA